MVSSEARRRFQWWCVASGRFCFSRCSVGEDASVNTQRGPLVFVFSRPFVVAQTTYDESCRRVKEAKFERRRKINKNQSDEVFDGGYRYT